MSEVSTIYRLGQIAEVLVKEKTGENEFGNSQFSYTPDREVIAARTYPNRNTQIESSIGDRNRDHPVFMVPTGPEQPNPPQPDDQIRYDGTVYEVQAHTPYDGHVEFFGEPVINDG